MNAKCMRLIKRSGKSAKEFCEDNRVEFKIVTEDELGIK